MLIIEVNNFKYFLLRLKLYDEVVWLLPTFIRHGLPKTKFMQNWRESHESIGNLVLKLKSTLIRHCLHKYQINAELMKPKSRANIFHWNPHFIISTFKNLLLFVNPVESLGFALHRILQRLTNLLQAKKFQYFLLRLKNTRIWPCRIILPMWYDYCQHSYAMGCTNTSIE